MAKVKYPLSKSHYMDSFYGKEVDESKKKPKQEPGWSNGTKTSSKPASKPKKLSSVGAAVSGSTAAKSKQSGGWSEMKSYLKNNGIDVDALKKAPTEMRKLQGQKAKSAMTNGGRLTDDKGNKTGYTNAENAKRYEWKRSQQNNSVGTRNMNYRNAMAQMNKAKEKLYEDQLNPKKKKKG